MGYLDLDRCRFLNYVTCLRDNKDYFPQYQVETEITNSAQRIYHPKIERSKFESRFIMFPKSWQKDVV